MWDPYLALLGYFVVVTGFLGVMLGLSILLGPKNPTKTKQLPFECGSVSVGNVQDIRFNVKFYLVAMLFILFDIEIIFMYPWAVNIVELGPTGFYAMLSFVSVLGLGFVYVLRRGVLNWND